MTPDPPRPWFRRLPRFVTRRWFLVTAAVVALGFVCYTLAGFLLVPRLIKTYVPRYAQTLKRRAEIGRVRVNPLLFTLEIKRFRLQESDGRPLLGFDRLFVDFNFTRSLFRAAWTFAEIRLEAPRIDAVLGADGQMNLAQLLDALPKSESASKPARQSAAPPRVLLHHAVVRGGVLSFTDLSRHAPQSVAVQPIDIELHDVTTLRERRGPYSIAATLAGGGVVRWDGQVSLVPVGSIGRFDLRGFPLATAWRFIKEDVALAEPAGQLDANLRYQFAYRDGVTSLNVEGVEVAVTGLVLAQSADKAPLLTLDKIDLIGAYGDVIARDLTVPEISVSHGRLAGAVARNGLLNWQLLTTTPQPADAPAPPPAATPVAAPPASPAAPPVAAPAAPPAAVPAVAASPARPWRLAVEKLRVEDLALSFVDRALAKPLTVDVAGLNLGLSARLEGGPSGLAGMVEDFAYKLSSVALREAPDAKTPLVSLDEVALEGGRIDLGAREFAVSRIGVKGGVTTVVRNADGSLPLVTMLGPAGQPKGATSPPPKVASSPAPKGASSPASEVAKPWTVALGKLDLVNHRLAITDRSVTPAVELGIGELKVSVRDVRTDGKKPWPFDASFRVVQGGRFTARGSLAPNGRAADATLTLTQLALTPAQPYVAKSAAVVLRSGDVSTAGRLTYRSGPERAAVTYTGLADVDRVVVVEADSGEPVVSWKSLHAEALRFGLAPDRLEIDELRLVELDGRLVIFKDRTLSFAKLMKSSGAPPAPSADSAPAPGPAPSPASAPASAPAPAPAAPSATAVTPVAGEAAPAFPVAIRRVRIDESSMHFADLSLVLPFGTRVHALTGVVEGLGSDPASRATVKLDGSVDEFGLMKVNGALSAFQPKVFTDLAVVFRNVPMSTLSPYSATFAGRRIKAGTLNLDLQYKIDRGALVGDNKVVLQQLQLGERVESPGAMHLPLDLAIAILSDKDGRIDIALPVHGNVDHPEFSYGRLIWQALETVITKVATSPFRALAGVFGGSSDTAGLEAVAFEAGSDVVLPPERQKLQRVAEVLDKRPRLKLTVHGAYEAKVDGEALRSYRVREDLAQQRGVKVKPGEDPGPVPFDDAKTQRALEALLAKRGGDKALDEFQSDYAKSTGKKAQRANPVLALVNRGSGDRAFYQALFRRLVETTPLPEAELTALAERRGEATLRVLKEDAGTAGGRAAVGDTEVAGRAEPSAIPTRLELGAVGT